MYDSPVSDPLVSRLLEPAVYPFPVERVELVETHISWVLLAGERVYKIKKPVDLGFLDFTTLERRRFFCEEEVRLNRRLAPDVYLGTIELTGTPAHPTVGGGGALLEVAVEMRRLPADRMLDRLVQADAVTPGLMEDIGHTVARFHAEAATGREIDALGGIDTVRRNWRRTFGRRGTSALASSPRTGGAPSPPTSRAIWTGRLRASPRGCARGASAIATATSRPSTCAAPSRFASSTASSSTTASASATPPGRSPFSPWISTGSDDRTSPFASSTPISRRAATGKPCRSWISTGPTGPSSGARS